MRWSYIFILLLPIVPACSKSSTAVTVNPEPEANIGIESDHTLGMPPADALSLDEIGCAVDEDQP